jgi:hypothetical protein
MSATQANIDSGLSGKPSDDIDKQTGPTTGSNVESPGSTLGTATKPVTGGDASNQGSSNNQAGDKK